MALKHIAILVALVAVACGNSEVKCPNGCKCTWGEADCSSRGLRAPPSGDWSDIVMVFLQDNAIPGLKVDMLEGFSKAEHVDLSGNPLGALDLNALAEVKNLVSLHCSNCQLKTVKPLLSGNELPRLSELVLDDNELTDLPEFLLYGFGKRKLSLHLDSNPISLPGHRPLLLAEFLSSLSLMGVDASKVTVETFSGITNLRFLNLMNSNVTDVSDTFASLPHLQELYLAGNDFKKIRKGFLSPRQKLAFVGLEKSSLEVLEEEALIGMKAGSILNIEDTPLACKCMFEDLHWWAQRKSVKLNAKCVDSPPCDFTNEQNSPLA